MFGKENVPGGVQTLAFWGLLFHFFIAIAFSFLYFSIYPKLKLLRKNILLSALVYGLFVWIVMNMIVLPLSAYKTPVIPLAIDTAAKAAAILVVCIGLPIAIGARLHYKRNFK